MLNLFSGIFFGILALLIAIAEIEAEGKYGWGQKFPTWYKKSKFWLKGKPMTGYHIVMFPTFFLLFHIPFFLGMEWSWKTEATSLSLWAMWILLEDILWITLNPHYGLKNFKEVWWHNCKMYFGVPEDFWTMILISVGTGIFSDWEAYTLRMTGFAFILIVAIFGRKYFVKYYDAMRKRDDRDKYPIIPN